MLYALDSAYFYKTTSAGIVILTDLLGRISPTTMNGWVKKYKESPETPFPGSGHLKPEDERLRKLEKEIRELKEENEILKKAAAYFAKNQK